MTTERYTNSDAGVFVERSGPDWVGIFSIIGLVVLVILCAGSPDLLDAIIHRLMTCGPSS